MENSDQLMQSDINIHRLMELAVPLFSFGGIVVAFILLGLGNDQSYRIASYGCIIASFILAYLAWIRPKKDIVALTTPLYAVILFVLPSDLIPDMILPILYAVSLTILLVRLKYQFGKPGTAASLGKELGGPLKTYIERTGDLFSGISPEAAHSAAVVFVRFAEGNYEHAAQSSRIAEGDKENPDHMNTLIRAFSIIQEHSNLLHKSLPRPVAYLTFLEKDSNMLAKSTVPAPDDDFKFYTTLDNALLLVYSAAWNNSERDRPHLLACQKFAQKLMSSK